jgi:hypothetical protein
MNDICNNYKWARVYPAAEAARDARIGYPRGDPSKVSPRAEELSIGACLALRRLKINCIHRGVRIHRSSVCRVSLVDM